MPQGDLQDGEDDRLAVDHRAELRIAEGAPPTGGRRDTRPARPPVAVVAAPPLSHLPAQPGPLIGRARELSALVELVRQSEARLVTLTGPAGVGKTRLAVAAAEQLEDRFADGARFVDLAPLTVPALVPTSIAQTLGTPETEADSPLAGLLRALQRRQLLLVLDNFEHLLDAAPVVAALLERCPGLTVVATSREPLHLRWEHEFPVPPLALPDPAQLPTLGSLAQVPAVALFVRRARAVLPSFQLSDANAAAVAELCRRLDGLPLAIELAAARVKVLPPASLLARIGARLDLLRVGDRDRPVRHQEMRVAIGWSYELLAPPEQALLRQLAVFAGSFTLEAAEGVWSAPVDVAVQSATAGGGVVETLTGLVDKGLLQREAEQDGEAWFRLLETVRVFAHEQLDVAGDAESAKRRHAAYFLALAERAEPELWGPRAVRWLRRLDRAHDNIRVALRRLLVWGDVECAERLVGAVGRAWQSGGHVAEGRAWLDELLARPDSPTRPARRAKLLTLAGALAETHGDLATAGPVLDEALALWRQLGDQRGIAWTMSNLGYLALMRGDLDGARRLLDEGVAASRAGGHRDLEAFNLRQLGYVTWQAGDDATARELLERALALAREVGFLRVVGLALLTLGWLSYAAGDRPAAQARFSAALAQWQELGEPPSTAGTATALAGLGHLAVDAGDAALARSLFQQILDQGRRAGGGLVVQLALEGFARLAAARREPERALRLFAAAARLQEGMIGAAARGRVTARWVAPLRDALGPRAEAIWAAGRALTPDEAVSLALAVPHAHRSSAPPSPWLALTRREREVAVLLAEGLTNHEIAERLVVGERTVETHVHSLLRKLGLRSRFQVAAWAAEQGLVPRPPSA